MGRTSLEVANDEYLAEFPAIGPYLEMFRRKLLHQPVWVGVQRLDLDVLSSCPQDRLLGDDQLWSRYTLIGNHQVLSEVFTAKRQYYSFRSSWRRPWRWWFSFMEIPAETVEEALLRLGPKHSELKYVILSNWWDHQKPQIVIYKHKMPVFSIHEFIETERVRVGNEARAKIASV